MAAVPRLDNMHNPNAENITKTLTTVSDLTARLSPGHLEGFLDELFSWNPQLGLVSKRSTPTVVARLIRQSVDMWKFVAQST